MSFEFNVKRNSVYTELIISTNDVNISSGLLDEKESIDLAKELIYAAERLLPPGAGEIESRLCAARKDLYHGAGS